MSSERETIYVALMDEGIDVWRPVAARKIAPDTFLILDQDYDREVETWQFEPGTVVRCRRKRRNGRQIIVATDIASRTRSGLAAEGSPTQETPWWRGKLKLSLVTCPVCLYPARRMMEPRCKIDRILSIEMFVDQHSVDDVFFDNLFYLLPDGNIAEETYAVIYESMRRKGVAALCQFRYEEKNRQVMIVPGQHVFRLYPLWRMDEIVQECIYKIKSIELDPEMISLAERLVDLKSGEFKPDVLMVDESRIGGADLETAVNEGIRTGKVISLKHALESSVKGRSSRNAKSRNEGSG